MVDTLGEIGMACCKLLQERVNEHIEPTHRFDNKQTLFGQPQNSSSSMIEMAFTSLKQIAAITDFYGPYRA